VALGSLAARSGSLASSGERTCTGLPADRELVLRRSCGRIGWRR